MPRHPASGDGTGAPLPPVGAGILPGAIGPAVSGHFSDPAADAAFVDADGGLWLRRYGEDAVPTGIMFTPAEVGLMVDAITAGPGRLPGRYTDDVRHFTGRWIPFTERRGLEETTLGPTAYPAVKAKGDRSMPSKRERPEDADGRVPQGPRDKVRTALFEPQSPGMQAYIPRHSV